MTTESLPYEGRAIRLGDREFIVPAMTIGAFRRLLPRLKALEEDPNSPEAIETVLLAAEAALRLNYPTITAAELEDRIDLTNMPALIAAVLGRPAPAEG